MNKIASAILFDVGCRKLSTSEDSFFFESKRCLSRLILRKMFSDDNDEMGVILFGSEKTENCMPEHEQDNYSTIQELCVFGKPNFKLFETVESVTQCKGYKSDWIRGIIVALEYLRKGIQGKRYKTRQIVIFSEFPSRLEYNDAMFNTVVNCMKDLKVNLTIVGPELDFEDENRIPDGFKPVLKLLELIEDPLPLSLHELAGSIKYFEKKRKTKRVYNVDLEIGTNIKIPVGWVKLTSETQRFSNWVNRKYLDKKPEESGTSLQDLDESEASRPDTMDVDDSEMPTYKIKESVEDVFKVTKFGSTEVTLSSADINALKRESGPPSFKILMFCSKHLVNPTMYVGEDIFAVTPRDKSNYSQAKLYALIDAMKENNKVAVARRIVMRNGKIQIGVLIPFSDECGKHLYFLKLPTAEWAQPFPRHRGYPKTIDPSVKESFKNLVDSMRLPSDLVEESQGLLVPNPHFQLRCQLFSDRARDPSCDINVLPEYIRRIVEPRSENNERAESILKDIVKALPSLNSLLRKEETSKRAQARASRKTFYAKKESSNASNSSSASFNTAKDSVTIQDETNITPKTEVKVEEEDVDQFYGLIEQLTQDVDMTASDMLQEIE